MPRASTSPFTVKENHYIINELFDKGDTKNFKAFGFASQLLRVGDVQLPAAKSDTQVILPYGQIVDSEDALMTYVFPDTHNTYRNRTWLKTMR